jgi:hypothetical protein
VASKGGVDADNSYRTSVERAAGDRYERRLGCAGTGRLRRVRWHADRGPAENDRQCGNHFTFTVSASQSSGTPSGSCTTKATHERTRPIRPVPAPLTPHRSCGSAFACRPEGSLQARSHPAHQSEGHRSAADLHPQLDLLRRAATDRAGCQRPAMGGLRLTVRQLQPHGPRAELHRHGRLRAAHGK